MKKNIAIIVAGGNGSRMRSTLKKQYIELKGIPVIARTLSVFTECSAIHQIIAVLPENDIDFFYNKIMPLIDSEKNIQIVPGGKERQESAYKGLMAVKDSGPDDIVVIHDGVRPFITPAEVELCIEMADKYGASIMAVPAFETLKASDGNGFIVDTINRDTIYNAQTPQAFKYQIILNAHEFALKKGLKATDDSFLVENLGFKIHIAPGKRTNIKLTTQEDIAMGNALLDFI